MSSDVRYSEAGAVKEGSYIVIDGEACRVVEVEKSKTGKHGSTKVRIVGIGVFDNVKRTLIVPSDAQVEVPVIEKGVAQVLAVTGDSIQFMDMQTYETFELPKSYVGEELASKLSSGVEVEYWKILGRRKIVRIRG